MGKEERIERMIPAGIEPEIVFAIFEEISRIPRGSGHEERIGNWLVDFAERYNLESVQDAKGNVLIRKPGSPGKENHPAVILQSHMDMVCEKIPESDHDFQRDPIRVTVEGDKILARETTLGADDGIGMALSLALLIQENTSHPPLEVLITVDEEIGLTGAEAFDASQLKGEYFINLDSGDEGVFVAGSAGGPTIRADIPLSWKEPEVHSAVYCLTVDGLLGGHSGEDIHRNRGNANKLLFRLMDALERVGEFEVASIHGGISTAWREGWGEAAIRNTIAWNGPMNRKVKSGIFFGMHIGTFSMRRRKPFRCISVWSAASLRRIWGDQWI